MGRRVEEHRAPPLHPLAHAAAAGDVGEAGGGGLVVQQAGAVEQVEFRLHQFRQVGVVQCAVVVDQLAHDAPRVGRGQPEQVAHDGARGVVVHPHLAALPALPRQRLAAQDAGQLLHVGQ